jgi:hypothetical protein
MNTYRGILAAICLSLCVIQVASGAQDRADTRALLDARYRALIDAENRHDIDAVRSFVWQSPNTLFVAKTATAAEGGWAGFWGTDTVVEHFQELYRGTFVMRPDYARVKTVEITGDVAETYAPLTIAVSYAEQTGLPRPFLMIVTWVRTPEGWKMATDVALPIPDAAARGS